MVMADDRRCGRGRRSPKSWCSACLLYPTLRLRLPPWPAALLSAALFGVAHGYGLQGFAAVTWSGMIWALGYERTRSLLPGMLAHAASNLLATTSFLLLLRF